MFDNEIFKGILEILSVIIIFVVGKFLTRIADKMREKMTLGKSFSKSHQIRVRLSEARSVLHASRAMIFQFHNGKEFVGEGNLHSYFLSCMYESVDFGMSAEIQNLQNIPVSNWSTVLTHIMELKDEKYPIVVIGERKDMADWTWSECGLITTPARWKVDEILVCMISSKNSKFSGIAVFGFDENVMIKDDILNDDSLMAALGIFIEDTKL